MTFGTASINYSTNVVSENSKELKSREQLVTLPDSMRHKLCGLPFSTRVTRSLRSARRSTYTEHRSGLEAPYAASNATMYQQSTTPTCTNSFVRSQT